MCTAFDELELLLKAKGLQGQHRIAAIPIGLWRRLQNEVNDPFAAPGDKKPNVLWYRNRVMLVPSYRVLQATEM